MRTALAIALFSLTLSAQIFPEAPAMDLKPYAGPDAPLMADDLKQRLALWRSLTVDAYTAKGTKDPRFDDDMLRLLETAAAITVGAPPPMAEAEALVLARRLAGPGGSGDPLAKWVVFRLSGNSEPRVFNEAAFAAVKAFVADAKAQPGGTPRYAHLILVYPLNRVLHCWGRAENPDEHKAALHHARHLAKTVSAVIRQGECDPAPSTLIRLARNLDLNHQAFSEPIVLAAEAALAEAKTEPWLAAATKAALRINNAWAWRGGGWASSVTPEGWDGFNTNLAEADRQLGEAYRLHPQEPLLGVMGIKVANAGTSQATVEEWMRRSVAARFDCLDAYNAVRNFQRPRWGGSYAAMLALGCDCVDTGRFDTEVPWNLINCIISVIDDGHDMNSLDEMRQALASPRVATAIEACFTGYAKRHPALAHTYILPRVAYLWHAGRTAEARAELEKLPADKRDPSTATFYHLDYPVILGGAPVKF